MFHALAASNVDCGLDHRDARRYLNQDRQLFSPPVQRFIDTFGELQDARHAADYDPSRVITPSEAMHWIDRAEAAIGEFVQIDRSKRTAVAIQALIRRRSP